MIKMLLILNVCFAQSIKEFSFVNLNGTILRIQAKSHKEAASVCFDKMTNGVYQGEEKSLDIIDRCANPIKGL